MHKAAAKSRAANGGFVPPRSKPAKLSRSDQTGVILALVGADALLSCLWVLVSSVFAEVVELLVENSPVAKSVGHFTLNLVILLLALILVDPLCSLLGGAMFNPVLNAALMAAGKGSPGTNIMRMGGQLVGGLVGAVLAVQLVPAVYQEKFHFLSGGLAEGVPLMYGFACELLLGFIMNFVFLESLGAKSRLLSFWLPTSATAFYVVVGSYFTGPSLNPMISFGWYVNCPGGKGVCAHSSNEHLILFWIAPFVGAIAAGLMYQRRHAPPVKPRKRLSIVKSRRPKDMDEGSDKDD